MTDAEIYSGNDTQTPTSDDTTGSTFLQEDASSGTGSEIGNV